MSELTTAPIRRGKITELEGLRGLLAWWVVLSHCLMLAGLSENALPGPLRILLRGDLPVTVFVILSGFVIFMLLDKDRDTYATFITRRFFRLFPTFLVCLVAMLPLGKLGTAALAQLPWAGEPTIQWILADWQTTQAHLWQHLLTHLTMLHGLLPKEVLPDSPSAILGPAWSISLEWQFYLVAPLLLLGVKRGVRGVATICTLVVISAAIAPRFGSMFVKGHPVTYSLPGFLPLMAMWFFVGACSFYLYKYATSMRAPETLARVLVLVLAGVVVLTHSLPLSIWCAVIGLHLVRAHGFRSRLAELGAGFLNCAPVQWIGRISYSTYLCHLPVIYAVLVLLAKFRPNLSSPAFFAYLFVASVAPILLCSHGLYTLIEAPFINFAKVWTSNWGARRAVSPALEIPVLDSDPV